MGFYGQSIFEVQDYFSKLQVGSTIDYVKDKEWTSEKTIDNIGPHATLRILGNGAWDFNSAEKSSFEKNYLPLADDWISVWIAPVENINNVDDSLIPTLYIAHDAPKFYKSNKIEEGYYVQGTDEKIKAIVRATPYYSTFKPIFADENEDETTLQFNQTISVPSFPIDLKGHVCFDQITYTEYKLPVLTWQEYTTTE